MGPGLHCSSCLEIFVELEDLLEEDCWPPMAHLMLKEKKPLMVYLLLNVEQYLRPGLWPGIVGHERASSGKVGNLGLRCPKDWMGNIIAGLVGTEGVHPP